METKDKKIGFIGQGWIGKNYADNFEARGFEVVRYSLEDPYVNNKDKIKECDVVFIAVPTPTTPEGFDFSVVRQSLPLVGKGKVTVIKSTILPGTTEILQEENPDIFVLHSPEFLSEATAADDAAHPVFNIIGLPHVTDEYKSIAQAVMMILPPASIEKICYAKEAEFFKYVRNSFFFTKIVFMNLLYDLATALGCDWSGIKELLKADPWVGPMHIDPIHKSGRGAGGHCFIKDFAAFVDFYDKEIGDEEGQLLLEANVRKNISLLLSTGKDLDILAGIYGENIVK